MGLRPIPPSRASLPATFVGQYATVDRPDAADFDGKILWDTDLGAFFTSDGAAWSETALGGGGGGYTTPTVVGAAFNRGSSNAPNCTIPAGVEPGDILVAFVGSNYATSGAPAGWVLVAASNNNQHNSAVMVRSADGTESGTTPASSLTGSEPWAMHIVVVRGSSRVVRGSAVQSSNTVASVSTTFGTSAASVSPSIGPHDLVLALGSFRSTGAAMSMAPAGTTVTTDNADTGAGESIVTASSGNGLSTTFTASHAASTTGVALAILALSA